MKLSIIVPCYNEVDNVSKLRNELLPVVDDLILHGWQNAKEQVHSAEMIFVDDGSRDDTYSKLQENFKNHADSKVSYKFLKHDKNIGLGAAIRTGFLNADGDILITVDSDGTYKFSEIPNLLSCLTLEVDIVTASPYHPEGDVIGVPAYRLLLSRSSSLLYRILVDWNVHTYTCLFRAYRPDVVKNIDFESDGFLAGTEILVNAKFRGYRVAEFPAVLYKREYGVSKARIAQTIFSHLNFQWRVLHHRLQSMFGIKSGQTI